MARLMAVAVAAMLLFASTSAQALTWTWNYIDGSTADGKALTTNSAPMDAAQFVGESIAIYAGLGGAAPQAGDTFIGYSFFRLTAMSLGGKALSPAPDGTFTYGLDHEISGAIFYTGKHVDAQNFVFTSGDLRVFFDAGDVCVPGAGCPPPTAGFTPADLAALGTFVDGVLVETGNALGIGGVLGATIADGASDFVFELTDVLSTLGDFDPFELTSESHLLALTDNNSHICGPSPAAACFSSLAAILAAGNALFGNSFSADGATTAHSANDGSIEKAAVVPLPASLLLLGAGLSAVGFWARRTRRSMV